MAIINLRNLTIGHSTLPLLENANLAIEQGERVCLIGRNGVGKSTLLKLIHGEIEPDAGSIEKSDVLKIAYLPQEIPHDLTGSIAEIVANAVQQSGEEQWQINHVVDKILSKLQLNGDLQFQQLSGGLKRRTLLACILAENPDVLLLDEPTNHLDIDAINTLENFLKNFRKTFFMITHDRVLMQNVANHIVEIDNGKLFSWRGQYEDFLKYKQSSMEAEARANALFDKRLAQEEQWIRQGIKARRTRNEGRVRMLKKMREERSKRRIRPGQVVLTQSDTQLSGKIVFEVDNISYSIGEKIIIKDFSTVILRGDKVGIIGPNGSGKSTLLNLLLGHLIPDKGIITEGTKTTIGYFDQTRMQLENDKTVFDNVYDGSDVITIGETKKHIMSYLQDFLFAPDRSRSLVKNLSGGERNRLLLAKLFTKPCNVLVLDEPTNDLDVETLELLEEQLSNFDGTILLVSHDRAFLNNLVTSTLVIEQNGRISEYVGGYDDYLRQHKVATTQEFKKDDQQQKLKTSVKSSIKLSFNEERELKQLPQQIESLENQIQDMQTKLADPQFYKTGGDEISAITQKLQEIEKQLEEAYKRWDELEKKTSKSA